MLLDVERGKRSRLPTPAVVNAFAIDVSAIDTSTINTSPAHSRREALEVDESGEGRC